MTSKSRTGLVAFVVLIATAATFATARKPHAVIRGQYTENRCDVTELHAAASVVEAEILRGAHSAEARRRFEWAVSSCVFVGFGSARRDEVEP
jgi:hypothetical protein